jgi:hypothetical protein
MLSRSRTKWFFIIAAFLSAFTFIWLILTPSRSGHLFVLNYSFERFSLIFISLLLAVMFSLGICLSNNQKINRIFNWCCNSRILFVLLLFFDLIFLTLFTETFLHFFGPWNVFLERVLPIIVFVSSLFSEMIVFQQIASEESIGRLETTFSVQKSKEAVFIKSNGRDSRLDFLRGFFVLVMIIDHVSNISPLYLLTFGNRFFTSAAEGFFLISGIVTGLVYYKVIVNDGLWAGIKKSCGRALTIYLITISIGIIVLFLGKHVDTQLISGVNFTKPVQMALNILSFKTIYHFSDILVNYCLLFFFFPLPLILLRSGKSYWLWAISTAYYIAAIAFPSIKWFPIQTLMDFSGAQFIFISGVVLGYNHLLEKIQQKIRLRWLMIFGMLFVFLVILWNSIYTQLSFHNLGIPVSMYYQVILFFEKMKVSPGRILASIIVFSFLYILLTLYWKKFKQLFGWLILPLGENSLVAFSIHAFIVAAFIITADLANYDQRSYWFNGLLQVICVMITWILVKTRIFSPHAREKKVFYCIPPILFIAFLIIEVVL